MASVKRSALILYSAEQMYDLVNDIEHYPRFMDGCVGAEVFSREQGVVVARLDLARAGINMSFVTRNTLLRPEAMKMQLVDGPFKRFSGEWRFDSLRDDACKVSLHLDFLINSAVASAAAGKMLDSVGASLVDSICKRADQVYGR